MLIIYSLVYMGSIKHVAQKPQWGCNCTREVLCLCSIPHCNGYKWLSSSANSRPCTGRFGSHGDCRRCGSPSPENTMQDAVVCRVTITRTTNAYVYCTDIRFCMRFAKMVAELPLGCGSEQCMCRAGRWSPRFPDYCIVRGGGLSHP